MQTYKFSSETERQTLPVFVRGNLDIVTCGSCPTNYDSMFSDTFIVGHFNIAFFSCIFPFRYVKCLKDIEAWVLLSCTYIHSSVTMVQIFI